MLIPDGGYAVLRYLAGCRQGANRDIQREISIDFRARDHMSLRLHAEAVAKRGARLRTGFPRFVRDLRGCRLLAGLHSVRGRG
jgi:hypothetical protein